MQQELTNKPSLGEKIEAPQALFKNKTKPVEMFIIQEAFYLESQMRAPVLVS